MTTPKTLQRPIAKEAAALAMSLGAQAGGDLPTARRTAGEAYRWLCHHDDTFEAAADDSRALLAQAWANLPTSFRDDPDFDSPSTTPAAVAALGENLARLRDEVARLLRVEEGAAENWQRLMNAEDALASTQAEVRMVREELQTARVRLAAAESLVTEWKGRASTPSDLSVELAQVKRELLDTQDHAADEEVRASNAEAELASLREFGNEAIETLRAEVGKLQAEAASMAKGLVAYARAENASRTFPGPTRGGDPVDVDERRLTVTVPAEPGLAAVIAAALLELPSEPEPVDEPDVTAEDLGVAPMTRTVEMVAEGVLVEFPVLPGPENVPTDREDANRYATAALSPSELASLRTAEAEDNAADAEPEGSFVGMPADGPTPAEVESGLIAAAPAVDPFAHLPPVMRGWMREGR